jgi:serine/threonine protein kinase
MTMEYMEGKPLDRLIKQYSTTGLPLDDVWSIIQGMSSALIYAHAEKIVHADLKPGNVFVTTSGMARIFDFGIARAVTHIDRAEGGFIDKTVFDAGNLGALTPAYASYEMLKGEEPDVRDDIYALGCITYELLTGKHPFDKIPADEAKAKSLSPKRIKTLSKRQWKAIESALAFERKDRIGSVSEFHHLLTVKPKSKLLGVISILMLSAGGAGGYVYIQNEKSVEEPSAFSENDIRNEIEYKVRLDLFKEELGKLLADPIFSSAWEDSVWKQFSGVSELLPTDDSWLLSTKDNIYTLYLQKIREKVKASEVEGSKVLINNAYRFAGDTALLKEQERILAESIKRAEHRNQELAQARQEQQKKQAEKEAEQQAEQQRRQAAVDEYNLAFSNVQRQLECRKRLNMRDFDIAIKKLKSLDMDKYARAEGEIIASLVDCISAEAKAFPERAVESKKYALRIFPDNLLIAAIKIVPRDPCDESIAGLGSRGHRATCSDEIEGIGNGPELVVVPTGKGIRSFAIAKYEASVAEFKLYCKEIKHCIIDDAVDQSLPVTGQSIDVINGYLRWLSEKTGKKYRLPTKDEWVYAASSANLMVDPNRNCFFSSRQIQKGDRLVRAATGKQNGWGLVNYLGNAEELVYEKSGKIIAVGGSYENNMDECEINYWRQHNGQLNAVTGFRMVRELTK